MDKTLPASAQVYYKHLIEDLTDMLGSRRAVARQLGLGHHTIQYRMKNLHLVKREWVYAAQYLVDKIKV